MKKKYQLPKEFATKWLAALRSGKYKQGNGQLKSGDKFCCLGVACDLLNLNDNISLSFGYIVDDRYFSGIPNTLKGWASENLLVSDLTTMNDNGDSFTEIADWIEANVEFI